MKIYAAMSLKSLEIISTSNRRVLRNNVKYLDYPVVFSAKKYPVLSRQ